MYNNKQYITFRRNMLISIRKNYKFKYYPISKLNAFIQRKWTKHIANLEYSRYTIKDQKPIQVTFDSYVQIKEFDTDLPPNQ